MRYDGASPENGPRYLTRSGPYHGLPDGATFFADVVFLIETRPFPKSSDPEGAVFTACPAKGEERAMVEAAIEFVLRSEGKNVEKSGGRLVECYGFFTGSINRNKIVDSVICWCISSESFASF